MVHLKGPLLWLPKRQPQLQLPKLTVGVPKETSSSRQLKQVSNILTLFTLTGDVEKLTQIYDETFWSRAKLVLGSEAVVTSLLLKAIVQASEELRKVSSL